MHSFLSLALTIKVLKSKRLNLDSGRRSKGFFYFCMAAWTSSTFFSSFLGCSFFSSFLASFLGYSLGVSLDPWKAGKALTQSLTLPQTFCHSFKATTELNHLSTVGKAFLVFSSKQNLNTLTKLEAMVISAMESFLPTKKDYYFK